MARVTAEVRALLQERQERRKAELDAHLRDVQFAVGDEVLLDTEHTPLPSRSLLSPRWMGPFTVLACTATNTYRLDNPAVWRVFPEFNVERLLPYLHRPDHLGGDVCPPPPVPARPKHEVQELLRLKLRYGWPYVLVRWVGRDASGDTWEPLDNLTNCAEAIAAFDRATCRSLPRPCHPSPAAAIAAPPPPIPPADFIVDAAPPGDLGVPLVGRTLLHWWPDYG
jgi:hypothetical protein